MMQTVTDRERAKYAAVWAEAEYHEASPGAERAPMFMQMCRPRQGAAVLDVGAGAGAGSRALKDMGLNVTAFDLTDEAWRHDDIPLIIGSVWKDLPHPTCIFSHIYNTKSGVGGVAVRNNRFDFTFCCDMMEHLPTEFVGLAVGKILDVAPDAFFSVCFVEDQMGKLIGETLHLTVKPFVWWRDLFAELGTLVAGRDLFVDGVFHVRR